MLMLNIVLNDYVYNGYYTLLLYFVVKFVKYLCI